MPGVEPKSSVCEGPVVVALRGDLDVTWVRDIEAAITAPMARGQWLALTGKGEAFWVQPSVAAAVAGIPGRRRR